MKTSLTNTAARQLGTRIVKESNESRVKFGTVNGVNVLYAIFRRRHADDGRPERDAASFTINDASDWEETPYPYNESKRPRKPREEVEDDIAILHAVANREAQ
jgi:hypothetical protein